METQNMNPWPQRKRLHVGVQTTPPLWDIHFAFRKKKPCCSNPFQQQLMAFKNSSAGWTLSHPLTERQSGSYLDSCITRSTYDAASLLPIKITFTTPARMNTPFYSVTPRRNQNFKHLIVTKDAKEEGGEVCQMRLYPLPLLCIITLVLCTVSAWIACRVGEDTASRGLNCGEETSRDID